MDDEEPAMILAVGCRTQPSPIVTSPVSSALWHFSDVILEYFGSNMGAWWEGHV